MKISPTEEAAYDIVMEVIASKEAEVAVGGLAKAVKNSGTDEVGAERGDEGLDLTGQSA